MNIDQLNHYKTKLAFETDSWDLYEAMSRDEPVVVVDGRSAEAYAREHIPGAVNLPHREIGEDSARSLDRSKLYVCYCGGSSRVHNLL
ncbi:MAG: rhodanese-like domain-containing protein [Gemmatimonadota bacterium]|nr:rhodanese-like domain-containing protein [Gemmatimonadota bacterium]